MTDFFDGLTWACMVCGKTRPDDMISVEHRPLKGLEHLFPDARVNVRYCNDSLECTYHAMKQGVWEGGVND